MTREVTDEIRDTAEAVKGIVEAVPLYEDAVQPAARQVGKALETVAKTLHVVLAPIAALVWSYEKIGEYLVPALEERLRNVAAEHLQTPRPSVAGPAIEAMRWAGQDEELRDLYANLLATAIDSRTARRAHPGFVEIIRQLTPDEARILAWIGEGQPDLNLAILRVQQVSDDGGGIAREWVHRSLIPERAGAEYLDLGPSYLANLARLGLIDIRYDTSYVDGSLYDSLKAAPDVSALCDEVDAIEGSHSSHQLGVVEVTSYGDQFLGACVLDHDLVVGHA